MDASPGSQSRKGMGFRSWYCGSCGTGGNRPAVYFSGEPFFFFSFFFLIRFQKPSPLSIYRGLYMRTHVISVCHEIISALVAVCSCLVSVVRESDCGCRVSTILCRQLALQRTRIFSTRRKTAQNQAYHFLSSEIVRFTRISSISVNASNTCGVYILL